MSTHEHHTPASSNGQGLLDAESLYNPTYELGQEEMPPRDDHFDLLVQEQRATREAILEMKRGTTEEIRALGMAIANNSGRKPPAWASFALSLVALLGVGINIGVYISKAQQQEQATAQLREDYNRVISRFDKLRDLYMVQFGADPEDPNTKVVTKRK